MGSLSGNNISPQDTALMARLLKASQSIIPLKISDSSLGGNIEEGAILSNTKSIIEFTGGLVSYNYDYRSFVDTPFLGANLAQHYLTGSAGFNVAGLIPVRVNYLIRRSNSEYFKRINDVQIVFDGFTFKNNLQSKLRQKLSRSIKDLEDPAAALKYQNQLKAYTEFSHWLQSPLQIQKLRESQEILQIPGMTMDYNLPDSLARLKSDSIMAGASDFLQLYASIKTKQDSLTGNIDSLKSNFEMGQAKIGELQNLLNSPIQKPEEIKQLAHKLERENIDSRFLNKYKWLMGIRQAGLGKNQINYSELTAKNINSTGLNFEYNSWYYFALSAGTVDYRFRDFSLKNNHSSNQFLYLSRLGIGRLERNNLIVTLFKGQRQNFISDSAATGNSLANISGVSLETRVMLNRYSFIKVEVAQSNSPNFIAQNEKIKKLIDFSDLTNKGLASNLKYSIPAAHLTLDAGYKYTGAGYLSFTTFQSSSSQQAWSMKMSKYFFDKSLKIITSAKSNEFTNPYILQNYKNNTVFKSITGIYHKRKYPTISVGFMPVSQLTYLNGNYAESRFYSFNSMINYTYKISGVPALSNIIYSKFYNTNQDSGYLFYNANNLSINQSFISNSFSQGFGISLSDNNKYQLLVIEGNMSFNLKKLTRLGMGAKINNLSKLGTNWNMQTNIKKFGSLRFVFDQGFLPANDYTLKKNDYLSINFIKII